MAFTSVDGVNIHYRVSGTAGRPRLVFLNSLGSDFRIWEEVEARLGGRFEILSIDKRGHGLSEAAAGAYTIPQLAQDVLRVLEKLGWSRFAVVGLSIGGLIAQQIALLAPERIDALVLMDTAAKIGSAESWNERIAAVEAGGMAAISEAVVSRWLTSGFRSEQPAAFSAWRSMLEATSSQGYCGCCAALRDADLTEQVAAITAPTLVLCGDDDGPTPPDLVRKTAERIPGARFVLIPGAGHLPCLEQPEQVARSIAEHLDAAAANKVEAASRFDAGMAVRRRVLGDAHVNRASGAATPFDAAFQRFITEGAWGAVWSNPHLSLRERSMITIALLAALGQDDEVAMHVRATRNTGASEEDIAEALMHVAVYAGVPAANHAIKIAKKTLTEMREEKQPQ